MLGSLDAMKINADYSRKVDKVAKEKGERRISMKRAMINRIMLVAFLLVFGHAFAQIDPLPSWNDGAAKKAIVDFVKTTT